MQDAGGHRRRSDSSKVMDGSVGQVRRWAASARDFRLINLVARLMMKVALERAQRRNGKKRIGRGRAEKIDEARGGGASKETPLGAMLLEVGESDWRRE